MRLSRARILVAGCGAVGSVFACLLSKAGHDITLLGRAWHLDAIRSRGLRMDGIWGIHDAAQFHLATEAAGCAGPFDLILISVKAYDTQSMVSQVASYLDPNGVAISLQNGLGNIELLAESFGGGKSLGASILVGAKIPEPARVTVTVQAAPIVIGPLDSTSPHAMERSRFWTELLSQAGIPCESTARILSHLWAKAFYNLPLNCLGALLQTHYGALGKEPELKATMDSIIEEAYQVGRNYAVLLWNSAEEFRQLFYGKLLPATFEHQSSMLQDLERGKRTEVDALNGMIWRYGERKGLPTPFNEVLTRLIWGREKRS